MITQTAVIENTIAIIGEKLKSTPPKTEFNASPIINPNAAEHKIKITLKKIFSIISPIVTITEKL